MSRCKGNTLAIWGILVLGGGAIVAAVSAGEKDISIALVTITGTALGGLIQYITNRGTEAPSSKEPEV